MYLHIGKDIILKKEEILLILNYEKLKNEKIFEEFMSNIKNNNIIDISEGKKKSIIITDKNNVLKCYISNISSNTLAKRKDI